MAPAPRDLASSRRVVGVLAGCLVLVVGLAVAWKPLLRELARAGWLHADAVLTGEIPLLDEEAARALFPSLRQVDPRMRYDPRALVVLEPHRRLEWPWPEHPRGRVILATNGLGFREDEETPESFDGPRVLVLGDSHTEGLVDNDESYAAVLERRLDEAAGGARRHDVLNAGVGGTGPHNYLGMLRLHRGLSPDAVVGGFYTGNDFLGALLFSDAVTGRPVRRRAPGYFERLRAAEARWASILPQGFNQAALFAERPGDEDVALAATIPVFEQLAAECRALGAALLVVLLPTKPDVEPEDDRAVVYEILATLGLTREQYALNARLAERLRAALEERGIACLDPTEAMRAAEEPLYWRGDHHLSVAGHRLVGELLAERLPKMLARRP